MDFIVFSIVHAKTMECGNLKMHRFQRGRVITHNFENSAVGGQVKTKTFENSDGEFYSFGVDNGRKRVQRYPLSNENSINGQNELKMLVGTKTLSYVFGHVKTESFENPFKCMDGFSVEEPSLGYQNPPLYSSLDRRKISKF